MDIVTAAIRNAYFAQLGIATADNASKRPVINARAAGAKASATKGALGHKRAGIKAQITRLCRLRDGLSGPEKGKITKAINALARELETLH